MPLLSDILSSAWPISMPMRPPQEDQTAEISDPKLEPADVDLFAEDDTPAVSPHPLDDLEQVSDIDLRHRYRFIEVIAKQFDIENPETLGVLARNYAQYRAENRMAYYDRGQVDGWRLAGMVRTSGQEADTAKVSFIGVTEEGAVVKRNFIRQSDTESDIAFDWSVTADPLENTRCLAQACDPRIPERERSSVSGLRHFARMMGSKDVDPAPLHFRTRAFKEKINAHQMMIRQALLHNGTSREEDGDAVFKASIKMSHTAKNDEIRRYGALAKRIMAALDPDVRKQMNSLLMFDAETANFLVGADKNGEGQDETRALYRQQAIATFPLFAPALMNESVQEKIDDGGSSLEALSKNTGISPKHLGRLRGLTWQKMGRDIFYDSKAVRKNLELIDPNHVPQTHKGIAEMETAIHAAAITSCHCPDRTLEDVVSEIGGRFDKVAAQAEGNPPIGINDMADSIVAKVAIPAFAQELKRQGMSDDRKIFNQAETFGEEFRPLRGVAARTALSNSARWHRNLPSLEDALTDEASGPGDSWEPLVGEVDLGGGLKTVELRSQAELKREGRQQNHCVGGYTSNVLFEESLIFSIRKTNGDILSTIEFDNLQNRVTPRKGAGLPRRDINVGQHFGYENQSVEKPAAKAAKALHKHLNSLPEEAWERYSEKLQDSNRRFQARVNSHRVIRNAGYDPFDREKLEVAWEHLSPYLARPERKKGLDAWINDRVRPEVKKVTKMMSDKRAVREFGARVR